MADRFLVELADGQRVVTLPFTFSPGSNELVVSLNGQTLTLGRDYLEISITAFELCAPGEAGEVVEARIAPGG